MTDPYADDDLDKPLDLGFLPKLWPFVRPYRRAFVACLLLLAGFRYRHPMTPAWLVFVGIVSGVVFGGTYIALVAVIFILLGPYDRNEGRTLIISWSFFTALGFAFIAGVSGTTGLDDVLVAAPGAATYLLGTWLGSRGSSSMSSPRAWPP